MLIPAVCELTEVSQSLRAWRLPNIVMRYHLILRFHQVLRLVLAAPPSLHFVHFYETGLTIANALASTLHSAHCDIASADAYAQ